jgi:hypothetical protein
MSGGPWSNELFSSERTINDLCKSVDSRDVRMRKLEEALRKYGSHLKGCKSERAEQGYVLCACDCGFSEIFKEVSGNLFAAEIDMQTKNFFFKLGLPSPDVIKRKKLILVAKDMLGDTHNVETKVSGWKIVEGHLVLELHDCFIKGNRLTLFSDFPENPRCFPMMFLNAKWTNRGYSCEGRWDLLKMKFVD